MKTAVVLRKIRVIWVDAASGESIWERKIVQILAAILGVGLGACGILLLWR